jgi:hypothetical protein
MSTKVWTNTIDNTPPVGAVAPFATSTSSCPNFPVKWSGTDVGAGITNYNVYVSKDGGAFSPWVTNLTRKQGIYRGQMGHSYGFYSIATDAVGNVEPAKTTAEATEKVNHKGVCQSPTVTARSSAQLCTQTARRP